MLGAISCVLLVNDHYAILSLPLDSAGKFDNMHISSWFFVANATKARVA